VLGQVAAILGRHAISISSVLQREAPEGADPAAGVPVVITTHRAQEGNVRAALGEVDALGVIKATSVCIGIVDEYPEHV
jgi:homoserine dehydrogenase